MTRLDVAADPLGAAIRARPPEPRRPVWIHVDDEDRETNRWCVLREVDHQLRDKREPFITTLCCYSLPYEPVSVTTYRPQNTCPACETELAAGTPGAAVAVEPAALTVGSDPEIQIEALADDDAIAEPRVSTRDLFPAHRRVDPPAVWDGAPLGGDALDIEHVLPDVDSAFDPLNDLRDLHIPEDL